MHIRHARALHNKVVTPKHTPYLNCLELTDLFDYNRIAIDFVTQMYVNHDPYTKTYNILVTDVNGDEVSFVIYTALFLKFLRQQIASIEDSDTGELQIVQLFKIEHSYPSKQETYEITVTVFVLSVVLWCMLRQMY